MRRSPPRPQPQLRVDAAVAQTAHRALARISTSPAPMSFCTLLRPLQDRAPPPPSMSSGVEAGRHLGRSAARAPTCRRRRSSPPPARSHSAFGVRDDGRRRSGRCRGRAASSGPGCAPGCLGLREHGRRGDGALAAPPGKHVAVTGTGPSTTAFAEKRPELENGADGDGRLWPWRSGGCGVCGALHLLGARQRGR